MAPPRQPRRRWRPNGLSPEAWTVVGLHALFVAGVGLSTTFVNVYLWRNGGGLAVVARYHVALFVAFLFSAVAAGYVATRFDRVATLRLGVALHAAFFMAVLALGARAAALAVPLGALLGVGMGFYYLGASVLIFDFSDAGSAHHLVGWVDQARLAGMTLTPFLAGWAIDRLPSGHGYRLVFAVSAALFLVAIFVSRRLTAAAPDHGGLPLRTAVLAGGRPRWGSYLQAQGWRGLRDGVFLFLAGILVFERTRDEWTLGLFALGTGAVTWLSTYWVGSRASARRQPAFLTIGVAGSVAAAAALVFVPGWIGIVVFGLLESIFLPLVAVPFSAVSYGITAADRAGGPMRVAYMVAREIPLNLGRLTGVALLLIAVQWVRHPAALPIVLGGLGLANVVAWWVLRRGVF